MVRLIFLLIYNLIRALFLKVRFGKCIKINWIQRISPNCAIKVFGHGKLFIGRNCQMESGCDLQVHSQGVLRIGQRVYMNKYCMVSAHGLVEIGDNCIFGPGVKLFDNNHKFGKDGGCQELAVGSISIGKNCWIASNVVILKGTEIGDNCIIGAGCIVKGTIPSGSIVRPDVNNITEKIY